MVSICVKQYLSIIWGSIHKKVERRWEQLETNVAYEEKRVGFVLTGFFVYPLKKSFLISVIFQRILSSQPTLLLSMTRWCFMQKH